VDRHEGEGGSERDDLAAVMRRLAEGDEAAVVTLYERYGGPIAAAAQRVVRQRRGRVDRDDLDAIVFEVCFELASVAGAWSPEGGALPWVWARRRVANAVDRVLGQWAEPLDEPRLAGAGAEPEPVAGWVGEGTMLSAFESLVPNLDSARLLSEALDEARISTRDRELLFEYAYEKHSGNTSPAATVAPEFGMREVSVRQAFRRARQRLLGLAACDERFAPLAELHLLA
jgi:DNA-directed RNA polymerase specialized sigma24 family protein